MDRRRVECMMLVSDDSSLDFVDVLKEAKLSCLKAVVVGDMNDGALKRVVDAGFSWREVLTGKAREAELLGNGRTLMFLRDWRGQTTLRWRKRYMILMMKLLRRARMGILKVLLLG